MSFNMHDDKEIYAKMKEQFSPVELHAVTKLELTDPLADSIGARLYNVMVGAIPELAELWYMSSYTSYSSNNITLVLSRQLGTMPTILLLGILSKLETLAHMHGGVYTTAGKRWNRTDMPTYSSPVIEIRSKIITYDSTVDYLKFQEEYNNYDWDYGNTNKTKKAYQEKLEDTMRGMRVMYNFGSRDTKGTRSVDELSASAQKVIINKIKRGEECWLYTEIDIELPTQDSANYHKPQFAIAKFKATPAPVVPIADPTAGVISESVQTRSDVPAPETPVPPAETVVKEVEAAAGKQEGETLVVFHNGVLKEFNPETVEIMRKDAKAPKQVKPAVKTDGDHFETPVELKRGQKASCVTPLPMVVKDKDHDEHICPKIKGVCTACSHFTDPQGLHKHYCDIAGAAVEDIEECPE